MDEEKQLVEVGLITSVDQAKELAGAWLAKNPGYEWRGQYRTTIPGKMSVIEVQKIPIVDMENLSQFQIALFTNLTKALTNVQDRIQLYLKNLPTNKQQSSAIVMNEIFDMLPVRIVKQHTFNEQDSFADQMKSLQSMKSMQFKNQMKSRVVEQISKFLDRNRGLYQLRDKPITFDLIVQSVKQALVYTKGDEYELQDRDVHEHIKEAELQGLDDFLLQNQDQIGDPSLLAQLQETIKSYQSIIDERRFKNEAERDKILNLLRTLHKQVANIQKNLALKKKQPSPYNMENGSPDGSYFNQNPKKFSPKRQMQAASEMTGSVDAILKNRERVLKDIFDFYSRQQLQNQKSVTFDEINKDFHTINPLKLVRFTIDFHI